MKRSIKIPTHRRVELKDLAVRSRQVVVAAAITGVVTGLLIAGFEALVIEALFDRVDRVDRLPSALASIAPAVGLVIAFVLRRAIGGHDTSPSSADEYLVAFHDDGKQLSLRQWLGRTLASVATLGSGVPMGLEGPSIYTGAVAGSNLQRRLPPSMRHHDHRMLLVAGAAAGVAAIFKAPATGAVFALEVPYQDDLARRMLLPSLIGAAAGYLTFAAVHGTAPLFDLGSGATFEFRDLVGAVAVGVIAGIGARAFAKLLRHAKALGAGRHQLSLAAGAGLVLIGLFWITWELTDAELTLGPGYDVIAWAAEPDRSALILCAVLVLRCVGTATAAAGGAVGGLFIPLVVAGALTGSIVGHLVDHDDIGMLIIIGVAAFLGAGYRVPLAAVMFVAETTGRPSFVVPGLLASVAAELVMGPASITSFQRKPPPDAKA